MSAFLKIGKARKAQEKIDFLSMVSLGMHGTKESMHKAMTAWAREADISIRFED